MSIADNEDIAATPTIDQAKAIAAAGLRVLPIKIGAKHPPMASWQTAATVEPAKIDNWWNGLYNKCGIGIALGPQPNGHNIFAIDLDRHDPQQDGIDALAKLETVHGKLPDTVTSDTGGNGRHLLFEAPPGAIIRNQQSGGNRIAPGIDIRGDGGQIVCSPTIHPESGKRYEWAPGRAPWQHKIAIAPAWLLERVTEPPAPTPPPSMPASPTNAPQFTAPDTGDSIAASVREWWDWNNELTRLGWTPGNRPDANGDTYWTRPGKDPRDGHSAVLHGTEGPLVVFTTEIPQAWTLAGDTTRDGSGWSFSPFGFYAATRHNGDRSVTAKELRTAQEAAQAAQALTTPLQAPQMADMAPEEVETYDDQLNSLLIDWGEFWTADHGEAEWLAEPIIPAGRSTALFAPGGTGKSLLALTIAAAIATGAPIFGITAPAINVLYLDYEMTPDDLAERLEAMGYSDNTDLTRLHYALLPSLPGLDLPEGGKAVVRLAELVGADLVVIDTFSRAVIGDENDADTVRNWYRNTGLHLKHDGRAFLRVDHAGKDTSKGQRGTSAKNDDVDVVWQMTAKDEGAFTLTAKKRRMGWVPEKVELQRIEKAGILTFELADDTSWPSGTAEVANILDALKLPANVTARAAAKAMRDAGKGSDDKKVRAAVKYRRSRTSLSHLAADVEFNSGQDSTKQPTAHSEKTATESGESAVESTPPHPPEKGLHRTSTAPPPETPQKGPSTSGNDGVHRTPPHSTAAPAPQCGGRSTPHAAVADAEPAIWNPLDE